MRRDQMVVRAGVVLRLHDESMLNLHNPAHRDREALTGRLESSVRPQVRPLKRELVEQPVAVDDRELQRDGDVWERVVRLAHELVVEGSIADLAIRQVEDDGRREVREEDSGQITRVRGLSEQALRARVSRGSPYPSRPPPVVPLAARIDPAWGERPSLAVLYPTSRR